MTNVIFAKFGKESKTPDMEIIHSGRPFVIKIQNDGFAPVVCNVYEAHVLEGGQIVLKTVEYDTLTTTEDNIQNVWQKKN